MKPLVSVIIPNYNYDSFLREAVDSVLSQTYERVEVVVVDDGSTDSSRDVIESYGGRIKGVFQSNRGVSAARNHGVSVSSGQLVAFLDADDAWMPEKLERQVEALVASEGFDAVHVGVEEVDASGAHMTFALDGLSGEVANELLRLERSVILGGGSGILTTREAFDAVGGFDEQLSTSADWDFFYRIAKRGKVAFVEEPLLRYRRHGSNMHGNIGRMEREMLLAFRQAFESGAEAPRRICYGNLHRTISGSYFRAGDYRGFLRNAVLSVLNRPSNILYFASFPLRRMRRRD